jgi:hypothetical protein
MPADHPGANIIFLVSLSDNDALTRLQSRPLINGLKKYKNITCSLYNPALQEVPFEIGQSLVVIHYRDDAAIEAAFKLKKHNKLTSIACFGSDIYSYKKYVSLAALVDVFFMPTDAHKELLSAGLNRPVFCLPESIDPIVGKNISDGCTFDKKSTKLCWFGYPDSFYKSMASLLPVIDKSLKSGAIDDFSLITNPQELPKNIGYPVIKYSNEEFLSSIKNFDYTILSHLPLDLHLNTYIKSPNKAITALCAGVIPIASNTLNYSSLFRRLGLDRFLFSSPLELSEILETLDPTKDSKLLNDIDPAKLLRREFSDERLAKMFLEMISDWNKSAHRTFGTDGVDLWAGEFVSYVGFRKHCRDLIPSAIRAVKRRLGLES